VGLGNGSVGTETTERHGGEHVRDIGTQSGACSSQLGRRGPIGPRGSGELSSPGAALRHVWPLFLWDLLRGPRMAPKGIGGVGRLTRGEETGIVARSQVGGELLLFLPREVSFPFLFRWIHQTTLFLSANYAPV